MKGVIFILAFLLPALANAQPSVKFAAESHDFGEITEGEVIEYDFEFSNAGTGELLIERLAVP